MTSSYYLEECFKTKLVNLTKQRKYEEVLHMVKGFALKTLFMRDGNHLLHIAAQYNNIELIKRLPVKERFKLDVRNNNGHTPLITAIIYENYEIAKYLYNMHVDWDQYLDQKDYEQEDDVEDINIARLLYKLKKIRMTPAKIGVALAKITNCQFSDVIRFHNSITTEYFIQTARQIGTPISFDGVIEIIVDEHDWPHLQVILRYAPTHRDDNWFSTFWMYIMTRICELHNFYSGQRFLKCLFGSWIFGRGTLQPLEETLMTLETKPLKVFLQYNFASIVKANHNRYILASIFGNPFVNVKSLLKDDQIDVNGRGYNSKTPLHFAAESGLFDNVKLLLKLGANPNAIDINGCTPLSMAVLKQDYEECVKMLLYGGANPLLITKEEDLTKEHFYSEYFTISNLYVVAQILIYETLGRSIKKTDELFASWSEYNVDKFIKSCRKQLKGLKTQAIFDTQMTMFTVLAERPKKIACVISKDVVDAILTFTEYHEKKLIPYYSELLKKNAEEIREIHSYRERAIKIVCQFIGIPDPHHLVVNKIVDYFNEQDLRKFEEAENGPKSLDFSLMNKGMRLLKLTKDLIPFKF